MLEESAYERLRSGTEEPPLMFHRWRDLLFLHFPIDPALVPIPEGLTLDTFPDAQGKPMAWVGFVPFRMHGIRPRGGLAMPWISAFPETNVRTYVHRDGKEPGVWFFSLDAARWPACKVARIGYGLNYKHALMSVRRQGDKIAYRGRRIERPHAEWSVEAVLGEPMPPPEYGSLEFFLVERYLLYSRHRGQLLTGLVAHPPYPLRQVISFEGSETAVAAAGIPPRPWAHACFSEGVDVRVGGIG